MNWKILQTCIMCELITLLITYNLFLKWDFFVIFNLMALVQAKRNIFGTTFAILVLPRLTAASTIWKERSGIRSVNISYSKNRNMKYCKCSFLLAFVETKFHMPLSIIQIKNVNVEFLSGIWLSIQQPVNTICIHLLYYKII